MVNILIWHKKVALTKTKSKTKDKKLKEGSIEFSSSFDILFQRKDRKKVLPYVFNPFLTFPACFYIPIIFSNLNYNCSDLLDLINLQEWVKKIVPTFHCLNRLF